MTMSRRFGLASSIALLSAVLGCSQSLPNTTGPAPRGVVGNIPPEQLLRADGKLYVNGTLMPISQLAASLPASISKADADHMLVQIDPTQIRATRQVMQASSPAGWGASGWGPNARNYGNYSYYRFGNYMFPYSWNTGANAYTPYTMPEGPGTGPSGPSSGLPTSNGWGNLVGFHGAPPPLPWSGSMAQGMPFIYSYTNGLYPFMINYPFGGVVAGNSLGWPTVFVPGTGGGPGGGQPGGEPGAGQPGGAPPETTTPVAPPETTAPVAPPASAPPSASVSPSASPSAAPSASPSTTPSASPSTAPSQSPSASPAVSTAPVTSPSTAAPVSAAPSAAPSTAPTTPTGGTVGGTTTLPAPAAT